METNRAGAMEQTFDGEDVAGTRVLVIDDDHHVSTAIQMILAHRGCDTVLAPNARAGIRLFESSRFDVAMVDIFIPGMSGLEIIARLRQSAPTVPIVAMSGFRFRDSMHADVDFPGMAATRGATSWLRKPFRAEQLLAAINSGRASAVPGHPPAESQQSNQGAPP
jgi:DNA-binding response OmpR family regulator